MSDWSGLCGPRGCHNYGLVRGRNWGREGGLLSWGSFSVVVFVQPHIPLLILNTEFEKIKTAVEKLSLGYPFLPCKTRTTTKISISKQTSPFKGLARSPSCWEGPVTLNFTSLWNLPSHFYQVPSGTRSGGQGPCNRRFPRSPTGA